MRNLFQLYYDVHATKIQKRWKAFSDWKEKEVEVSAAVLIQKHFRGFVGAKRKERALAAIVKIQSTFRRWRQKRLFKIKREKARRREYAMARL